MPEDEKKHFNDIENFEWFNGNKEDYTCLRFIPKGFQNEPEIEKVYLNQGEVCRAAGNLSDKHFFLRKITAHKDKLFLNFGSGRLILVHLNEYFEALKENVAKPSSFEFCEAVKLPGGMPRETPMLFRNGFFYLQAKDEDLRIYTRIWDVDENTFTSYFKVDLKSAFPAGFLFPCRTLHPSGHFLRIDAVTVYTKFVDSCLGDYVVYKTKKSLRFKLIPLIPTEGHSSEQLVIDQVTLEKSHSHGIVPRFVEDGRHQLTFPTKGLSIFTKNTYSYNKTTRKFYFQKLRKMLFFDLQELICHTISLVGVKGHCIEMIYWLDEKHLVAVFKPWDKFDAKTKRLQKALYEVDYTKKKLKPKKTVFKHGDEMDLHKWFAHGFLTVKDNEYIVFARTWFNYLEADEKKHFDDLENYEWFSGNKENYTWLRFTPKEFDNEEEIGKVWINRAEVFEGLGFTPEYDSFMEIFAHKGKLYCTFGEGLLTIDMDKYFNDAKNNSASIISSDHCSVVIEKGPRKPATDSNSCLIGEQNEDWKNYERIWEIDEHLGPTQFMIKKASCDSYDCNSYNWILHPSGHFLDVDAHTEDFNWVDTKDGPESYYCPKKCFTFKLPRLKAIPMNIPGYIDANMVIFNKTQYPEKSPPFIKDEHIRITILVDREQPEIVIRIGYAWVLRFKRRLTDFLAKFQKIRH